MLLACVETIGGLIIEHWTGRRLKSAATSLEFLNIKLVCLRQRFLSSPLERGAGGV